MQENTQQKVSICETKTDKDKAFNELFTKCYHILQEYGEKKRFHYKLQSFTNPPVPASTIRGYCNRPESIPEKKRKFFTTLMGSKLYYALHQKIAMSYNRINKIEPLLNDLLNTVPVIDLVYNRKTGWNTTNYDILTAKKTLALQLVDILAVLQLIETDELITTASESIQEYIDINKQ